MDPHQHGVKGVFLAGDWVPIEECAEKFNNPRGTSGEKCEQKCNTCPRSRSRDVRAKTDGSYDVIVIGAGCIGAAVARELSRTKNSVLLLE